MYPILLVGFAVAFALVFASLVYLHRRADELETLLAE